MYGLARRDVGSRDVGQPRRAVQRLRPLRFQPPRANCGSWRSSSEPIKRAKSIDWVCVICVSVDKELTLAEVTCLAIKNVEEKFLQGFAPRPGLG